MALARRPAYAPVQPQQPVYLSLSQVTDKQVITRSSGRNLGIVGEAWVDPVRLEVVSLELETKKTVGSTVTGNIPLSSLKQIGDVVLVQDEGVLTDQPLDARFGFVKLLGLEVRTRSGRVLGKVRDFSFNPDSGQINKIEFDDFGLRFLPVNFFDTFSISSELVDNCAYGTVVVAAEDRQRQEKQGILSTVLRSIASKPNNVAGYLPDGYRSSGVAGYLPQGYSYEQWQNDIRRWEQETGIRYEDYMQTAQGGRPAAQRPALPMPGRGTERAGPSGMAAPGQQQPQQRYALPPASGAAAPAGWGRQQGYAQQPQQQQPQQPPMQQGGYYADPRLRGMPAVPGPAPGAAGRYPPQSGPAPGVDPRMGPMDPRMPQQQPLGQRAPVGGVPQRPAGPAGPSQPGPMQQQAGGAAGRMQGPAAAGASGNGTAPPTAGAPPGVRMEEWLGQTMDPQVQQQQQEMLVDGNGAAGQGRDGNGWDMRR